MRIDHHAPSGIGELRIFADLIHANNIGQVFDGAGLEEGEPVLLPFGRPVGNDDKKIRSLSDGGAENLWKAKIVTDKRRDGESVPVESHNLTAGRVAG